MLLNPPLYVGGVAGCVGRGASRGVVHLLHRRDLGLPYKKGSPRPRPRFVCKYLQMSLKLSRLYYLWAGKGAGQHERHERGLRMRLGCTLVRQLRKMANNLDKLVRELFACLKRVEIFSVNTCECCSISHTHTHTKRQLHALFTLCISRTAWLSLREQERVGERRARQVFAQRERQVVPLHLMHAELSHSGTIACERGSIFEGIKTHLINI